MRESYQIKTSKSAWAARFQTIYLLDVIWFVTHASVPVEQRSVAAIPLPQ
jgi:hypothetical protein